MPVKEAALVATWGDLVLTRQDRAAAADQELRTQCRLGQAQGDIRSGIRANPGPCD